MTEERKIFDKSSASWKTAFPGQAPEFPEAPSSTSKRSFLAALLGIGAAGVGALLAAPLARFVLYPLLAATTEIKWSEVGAVADLPAGGVPVKKLITVEQRDGWRKLDSQKAVYVVRDAGGAIHTLSPICPHLGCSVAWNDARRQFVCPCHGGVFTPDGTRVSGPPPRSLDELESKVEDGTLKVRYQYFRQLVATKQVLS